MSKNLIVAVFFAFTVTACGGGGSTSAPPPPVDKSTISGTAASGAPIVGIVNILGANGAAASSAIGSDGSYNIDVTSLTPPYILFAEGHVTGKSVAMYSAAVAAGTVNITPITDFILRNALAGPAESAYANWATSQVSAAALTAAEANAQQQLEPVLTAMGISSDVDLITSPFNADQTGLDMVLEALTITYNGTVATVTNNLSGSSFTDDFTVSTDDTNGLSTVDASTVDMALIDQQAMNDVWQILENLFATSVPTVEQLNTFAPYVADDYLNSGGFTKTVELNDFAAGNGPAIGFTMEVVIDRVMDVSGTGYQRGYWVRCFYSDSQHSDSFLTSMVFNGTNWLLYGDRSWVSAGIKAHSTMFVSEVGTSTFSTGYEFDMDDDMNYAYDHDARSAIVTGPGLPASGVLFEHRYPITRFEIYGYGGVYHAVASDTELSAVQDNAEYLFVFCPQSAADLFSGAAMCTPLYVHRDTVMKPPVLKSELNASMFVTMTTPSSHNASVINFGGPINVNWTAPEHTTSGEVLLAWWAENVAYQVSADPLPGATSLTLDTTGLPVPGAGEWSGIFIRTTDMYDRGFNMGWSFSY